MLLIRNKIEPLAQLVLVIYLMVIQQIQPEVIMALTLIKVFPETPELFSLYLIIRVSMISQVMFMNT